MEGLSILILVGGIAVGCILVFLVLQARLSHTFQSLSSAALVQNNQAFVQLAQATLEKFQAEAKGELALKQQSTQELVSPLKQSLERYEQEVLELERKREHAYGGLRQYLRVFPLPRRSCAERREILSRP